MKTIKILALVLSLLASSACLTGCIRELTLQDVKDMQEPQPANWAQFMEAGNREVGRGRIDRACERYQQAMDDADAKMGPNDIHIALAAIVYAKLQVSRGKYREAEGLYKRALEVQQASLPANSAEVIETRKALAAVLMQLFKGDEANQILAGIKAAPASSKKNKRHHR